MSYTPVDIQKDHAEEAMGDHYRLEEFFENIYGPNLPKPKPKNKYTDSPTKHPMCPQIEYDCCLCPHVKTCRGETEEIPF